MNDRILNKNISIRVSFYIAPDFLGRDSALLKLKRECLDKNRSSYSEEDFIKQIEMGNVIVAMLREDPIGYSIIKDNSVVESYVAWSYRDSNLENELIKSVNNIMMLKK